VNLSSIKIENFRNKKKKERKRFYSLKMSENLQSRYPSSSKGGTEGKKRLERGC
jgi:hypothetical protein